MLFNADEYIKIPRGKKSLIIHILLKSEKGFVTPIYILLIILDIIVQY